MRQESSFWIAPNWPSIGKITMTSQFSDMTLSSFLGIDPKSGDQKYRRLSFAPYLGTGTSKGYQIWHECL